MHKPSLNKLNIKPLDKKPKPRSKFQDYLKSNDSVRDILRLSLADMEGLLDLDTQINRLGNKRRVLNFRAQRTGQPAASQSLKKGDKQEENLKVRFKERLCSSVGPIRVSNTRSVTKEMSQEVCNSEKKPASNCFFKTFESNVSKSEKVLNAKESLTKGLQAKMNLQDSKSYTTKSFNKGYYSKNAIKPRDKKPFSPLPKSRIKSYSADKHNKTNNLNNPKSNTKPAKSSNLNFYVKTHIGSRNQTSLQNHPNQRHPKWKRLLRPCEITSKADKTFTISEANIEKITKALEEKDSDIENLWRLLRLARSDYFSLRASFRSTFQVVQQAESDKKALVRKLEEVQEENRELQISFCDVLSNYEKMLLVFSNVKRVIRLTGKLVDFLSDLDQSHAESSLIDETKSLGNASVLNESNKELDLRELVCLQSGRRVGRFNRVFEELQSAYNTSECKNFVAVFDRNIRYLYSKHSKNYNLEEFNTERFLYIKQEEEIRELKLRNIDNENFLEKILAIFDGRLADLQENARDLVYLKQKVIRLERLNDQLACEKEKVKLSYYALANELEESRLDTARGRLKDVLNENRLLREEVSRLKKELYRSSTYTQTKKIGILGDKEFDSEGLRQRDSFVFTKLKEEIAEKTEQSNMLRSELTRIQNDFEAVRSILCPNCLSLTAGDPELRKGSNAEDLKVENVIEAEYEIISDDAQSKNLKMMRKTLI